MSCPGAGVKISCYLLHLQKPDFVRIAVCVWVRTATSRPVSDPGPALLGRGTDGLTFDLVGGPELHRSRVPGNCQAWPNVLCPLGRA